MNDEVLPSETGRRFSGSSVRTADCATRSRSDRTASGGGGTGGSSSTRGCTKTKVWSSRCAGWSSCACNWACSTNSARSAISRSRSARRSAASCTNGSRGTSTTSNTAVTWTRTDNNAWSRQVITDPMIGASSDRPSKFRYIRRLPDYTGLLPLGLGGIVRWGCAVTLDGAAPQTPGKRCCYGMTPCQPCYGMTPCQPCMGSSTPVALERRARSAISPGVGR